MIEATALLSSIVNEFMPEHVCYVHSPRSLAVFVTGLDRYDKRRQLARGQGRKATVCAAPAACCSVDTLWRLTETSRARRIRGVVLYESQTQNPTIERCRADRSRGAAAAVARHHGFANGFANDNNLWATPLTALRNGQRTKVGCWSRSAHRSQTRIKFHDIIYNGQSCRKQTRPHRARIVCPIHQTTQQSCPSENTKETSSCPCSRRKPQFIANLNGRLPLAFSPLWEFSAIFI